MPRIRTTKPDFWEHEGVGTLSVPTRLLYIATWTFSDDDGLLRWTPTYLKSHVFMYDDDLGVPEVEALMAELEERSLVFAYRAGTAKQRLGWVVNFTKHQRINRPQPSKLPAPNIQNPTVRSLYGERDEWTCHLCREAIRRPEQRNRDKRREPADLYLSLDHVTPQCKGGTDHPSNIAASHVTCNKSKRDGSTKTGKRWEAERAARNDALNDDDTHSVRDALASSHTNSVNGAVNAARNGTVRRSREEVEVEVEGEGDARLRDTASPPPRCTRHRHLPVDDPGPACVGCRSVRQRMERECAQAECVAVDEGRVARIADQLAVRDAPRPDAEHGRALARETLARALRVAR